MKKRITMFVDMHYDIVKEIVILVAKSPDGARDIANLICVCKAFRKFIEDEDLLKVVAFDNLLLSGHWKLFQQREGLINRCAQVGHAEAQFLLSKIVLVSASQLLSARKEATDQEAASYDSSLAQTSGNPLPKDNAIPFSFMQNFLPDRTCLHPCGFHFDLVRFFLSRARLCELEDMRPFVADYMEYILGSNYHNGETFFLSFSELCLSTLDQVLEAFELKLTECNIKLCRRALNHKFIFWTEVEQLQALAEWKENGGRVASNNSSTTTLLEKLDESIKRLMTITTLYKKGINSVAQRFKEYSEVVDSCFTLLMEIADLLASVEDLASLLRAQASHLEDLRVKLILEFDKLVTTKRNSMICSS